MAAIAGKYTNELKTAYLEAPKIAEFHAMLQADMKAKELLSFYGSLNSFKPLDTKHHVQFQHTLTTVTVAWSNGSKINETIRNGMRKHLREILDFLKEVFEVKEFLKDVALIDLNVVQTNYIKWRVKNRLAI